MRKFIIHLLGGFTYRELNEGEANAFMHGKLSTLYALKQHAEKLYGSDNWASEIYNHIINSINAWEEKCDE